MCFNRNLSFNLCSSYHLSFELCSYNSVFYHQYGFDVGFLFESIFKGRLYRINISTFPHYQTEFCTVIPQFSLIWDVSLWMLVTSLTTTAQSCSVLPPYSECEDRHGPKGLSIVEHVWTFHDGRSIYAFLYWRSNKFHCRQFSNVARR